MSPIKSAVAVALASVAATSAYALDASSSLAANTVITRIGGSTAVDNTLLATETALATLGPGGICAAGTIDVYQIGNPSNRLTYCTGASTLPAGLAGVPLAIFKESTIGSFNGPGALAGLATVAPSAFQLNFLNAGTPGAAGSSALTAANCPTVSSSNLGANFNAFTLHQCNTVAGIQVAANPTGGIADVEANILKDPNGVAFPAGALSGLHGAPGLDVVWGVSVTKGLFYALQAAEHLSDGTVIASCNTANNDAPACAPSLSKAQVASLYQAVGLVTWDQLGLNNPSGDNNVYLCRRDDGSGTQASFEAYFLGSRCGGPTNPAGSKLTMPVADGQFVFTQTSTGNVRNCLQAFDQGGTPPTGTAAEPGHQWAIGVLSTEVTAGNLTASGANTCNDCFRMIAVDGVLPTLQNVANGYWPYWSTDVFYTATTGPDVPAANPAALFGALQGKMGHPTFTAITNATFAARPWGSGGDLAPAGVFSGAAPTIPATGATQASNPTNAYTKNSTGSVSNCSTPVLFGTGTGTTPTPSVLLGNGNVNHN